MGCIVTDVKPTNPKDVIGSGKLPMELVPSIMVTEAATAFFEGACKYGRYNWRVAGVRSSIYKAALDRHIAKWWNGEDCDATTRVRHLANALACIGIILDAECSGKLTDDRPPAQPELPEHIDQAAGTIKHLKELFKDHDPYQYTIADTMEEVRAAPIAAGYRVGDPHPSDGPGSVSLIGDEPGSVPDWLVAQRCVRPEEC